MCGDPVHPHPWDDPNAHDTYDSSNMIQKPMPLRIHLFHGCVDCDTQYKSRLSPQDECELRFPANGHFLRGRLHIPLPGLLVAGVLVEQYEANGKPCRLSLTPTVHAAHQASFLLPFPHDRCSTTAAPLEPERFQPRGRQSTSSRHRGHEFHRKQGLEYWLHVRRDRMCN